MKNLKSFGNDTLKALMYRILLCLPQVQKTVEFNDSLQATIELEFEKLFGAAFVAQFFGHPLSQDRVLDELEEGEILC